MNLREAAQQALEALSFSCPAPDLISKHNAAESALRAALEQPEQEPVAWQERQAKRMKDGVVTEWSAWYPCRYRTIDEAKTEACDHIPYEWRPLYTHPPRCPNCASLEAQNTELDRKLAELEREQETAVFTVTKSGALLEWEPTTGAFALPDGKHPLYTHPPRREWQGLTENEIDHNAKQAWGEDHEIFWFDDDGIALFARALETALKEKNT